MQLIIKFLTVLLILTNFKCSLNNLSKIKPVLINFKEEGGMVTKNQTPFLNYLYRARQDKKFVSQTFIMNVSVFEKDTAAFFAIQAMNFSLFSLPFNISDTSFKKELKSGEEMQVEEGKINIFDYDEYQKNYIKKSFNEKLEPIGETYLDLKKVESINNTFREISYKETKDGYIANYAVLGTKNNIGKNVILCNNKGVISKIGYFPQKYFSSRIYSRNAIIEHCSDTSIIYGFNSSDEIAKMDLNGNEIKRVKMSNDTSFLEFDETKQQNLAYIDKFLILNECNFKIFEDRKKNILVFKKNKIKNKNEIPIITCYVLDLNLTPKFKFNLSNNTNLQFSIYKYKNGFITSNSKNEYLEYYEIKD